MKLSTFMIIVLAAGLQLFAAASAALTPAGSSKQAGDLQAFSGKWLYVEDRTKGRPAEEQGPPMMVTFGLRIEEGRVVLERARSEESFPIDDSTVESAATGGGTKRVRGAWKDGVLVYVHDYRSDADGTVSGLNRREFRMTSEGLQVRVILQDYGMDSYALYCHPGDIPLPTPAK
ncbi:MAG: hypothetical protein AAGG01_21675, partial [Planctomycetota bacterium]